MAIRARLYKDRKRVAGDGMAIYGSAAIISRTGQVTVDAVNIRLDMCGMGIIPGLLLVTTGTKSVGGYGGVSFLRVYFVAINAGDLHLTMPARLPLRQSAGVAVATQVRRSCNDHAFFRVLGPVRPVAGLARDAGQHKLAGVGIVAGGVASKTLARLFHLLQVNLENGVKRGLSMSGVSPSLKFGLVALPATFRALVVTPNRKGTARLLVQGHTVGWHKQR